MRKLAWVLLAVSLLAGRAVAEGRWVKEGATQKEMTEDHYACLKESQRMVKAPSPEAKAYQMGQLGIYAGPHTASRQKSPDDQGGVASQTDAYRDCVSARGYAWVDQ